MRRLLACIAFLLGCAGSAQYAPVGREPADVRLVPQFVPAGVRTTALTTSPDGRLAMIGTSAGAVWLWDVREHHVLRFFQSHRQSIVAVAFAGAHAWSAAVDGSTCSYAIDEAILVKCWAPDTLWQVRAAAFSTDGTRAAFVLESKRERVSTAWVSVMELPAYRSVGSADLESGPHAVGISSDGRTVVVADGYQIQVLDERVRRRWRVAMKATAVAVADRGVIVARQDQSLELRSAATGGVITTRAVANWMPEPDSEPVSALVPVADIVIARTGDAWARAYAVTLGPGLTRATVAMSGGSALAVARAAKQVVTLSPGGHDQLNVNDLQGNAIDAVALSGGAIASAAFTDNGLVLGGNDSIARFDPATGVMRVDPMPGRVERISGDGNFAIVTPLDYGRARPREVWALGRDAPARVRMLTTIMPEQATFACRPPSHRCRVSDGWQIEDAATGDHALRIPPRDGAAERPVLSADGRRLARIARGAVELVDTTNGALIGALDIDGDIDALALSEDGALVAIAERRRIPILFGDNPEREPGRVHVIDVATGAERSGFTLGARDVGALAFAPGGEFLVAGAGRAGVGPFPVWRLDRVTQRVEALGSHDAAITSASVSRDGRHVVTTSENGPTWVWRVDGKDAVGFVLAGGEWIMYTTDGLFDGSRRGSKLVAAVIGNRAFPLEQFAATNNRPDQLLARMEWGRPDVLAYFAYRRRVRATRLGLASDAPATVFAHAPVVAFDDFTTTGKKVRVRATATSSDHALARYQVWINGVPVVDRSVAGTSVPIDETLELSPGENRIEVGAISSAGVESLHAVRTVTDPRSAGGQVYFVALGVSRYRDPTLALGYAAQDAADLTAVFDMMYGVRVHPAILDDRVTPSALDEVRQFLAQATVEDTVVLFVAGHGILSPDARAEFLFAPHDYDRVRPMATGIPFTRFEELLSGVAARRRLFLIDSCVSGERDEGVSDALNDAAAAQGMQSRLARTIGERDVAANPASSVALPREYLLQRDRLIFDDGAHRAGVVALGSSRWNELSYEKAAWGNGAFTEEIVRVLGDPAADTNHDGSLSFDELARAVQQGVVTRTGGLQHPTIATSNVDAGIAFPVLLAAPR